MELLPKPISECPRPRIFVSPNTVAFSFGPFDRMISASLLVSLLEDDSFLKDSLLPNLLCSDVEEKTVIIDKIKRHELTYTNPQAGYADLEVYYREDGAPRYPINMRLTVNLDNGRIKRRLINLKLPYILVKNPPSPLAVAVGETIAGLKKLSNRESMEDDSNESVSLLTNSIMYLEKFLAKELGQQ